MVRFKGEPPCETGSPVLGLESRNVTDPGSSAPGNNILEMDLTSSISAGDKTESVLALRPTLGRPEIRIPSMGPSASLGRTTPLTPNGLRSTQGGSMGEMDVGVGASSSSSSNIMQQWRRLERKATAPSESLSRPPLSPKGAIAGVPPVWPGARSKTGSRSAAAPAGAAGGGRRRGSAGLSLKNELEAMEREKGERASEEGSKGALDEGVKDETKGDDGASSVVVPRRRRTVGMSLKDELESIDKEYETESAGGAQLVHPGRAGRAQQGVQGSASTVRRQSGDLSQDLGSFYPFLLPGDPFEEEDEDGEDSLALASLRASLMPRGRMTLSMPFHVTKGQAFEPEDAAACIPTGPLSYSNCHGAAEHAERPHSALSTCSSEGQESWAGSFFASGCSTSSAASGRSSPSPRSSYGSSVEMYGSFGRAFSLEPRGTLGVPHGHTGSSKGQGGVLPPHPVDLFRIQRNSSAPLQKPQPPRAVSQPFPHPRGLSRAETLPPADPAGLLRGKDPLIALSSLDSRQGANRKQGGLRGALRRRLPRSAHFFPASKSLASSNTATAGPSGASEVGGNKHWRDEEFPAPGNRLEGVTRTRSTFFGAPSRSPLYTGLGLPSLRRAGSAEPEFVAGRLGEGKHLQSRLGTGTWTTVKGGLRQYWGRVVLLTPRVSEDKFRGSGNTEQPSKE